MPGQPDTWQAMHDTGKVKSLEDLAAKVGVERSYAGRVIRLASLAPDMVLAALAGKEPSGLSLTRLRNDLPVDWSEQRRLLKTASR